MAVVIHPANKVRSLLDLNKISLSEICIINGNILPANILELVHTYVAGNIMRTVCTHWNIKLKKKYIIHKYPRFTYISNFVRVTDGASILPYSV